MASPNPFWFEDLIFFLMDESRRLPERASAAAARARRLAQAGTAVLLRHAPAVRRKTASAEPATAVRAPVLLREAELLDEPLAWALATEPLTTTAAGVEKAVELHEKAREQLGAITYILDRMRDDLAPALTRIPAERTSVAQPDDAIRLDTSIEALLVLSRRNAATRPKDRVLTAA